MKKLRKFILLFILMVPFIVKADDYLVRPFEAIVINDNGTDIKGKDSIHLSKGDKIFISLEYDKDTGGTYIDDKLYEVAYKDIEPVEKVVDNSFEDIMDSSIDYTLVINKEMDVYNGPASVYEKVGVIKENDEVTYRYYYDPFVYVENDDIKGWVNAKENNLYVISPFDFITTKTIKNTCGSIPVNTVFTTPYIKAIDTYDVLVDYEGCKSLVKSLDDESMVTMSTQYMVNSKKIKLYETPEKDSKVLDTIPSLEVLNNLAIYYQKFEDGNGIGIASPGDNTKNRFYVEYNGRRGWISSEEFKTFYELNEAKKYAKKAKMKKIVLPILLISTVVICLLAFFISSRKK